MARNLKKDYLKKLAGLKVGDFKIDLANYIYNPSLDCEYPSFTKSEEAGNEIIVTRYYYMKYYDGTGDYNREVKVYHNNGDTWNIGKIKEHETLQTGNRFSLSTLQSLVK